MSDSPTPIDGAIVAFLLRVISRFEDTVSDPERLIAELRAVGLSDPAVTQLSSFVAARAGDVSKLSTDLPKLLDVLESSSPDLPSLVAPAQDLWTVVSGLVADAPKLTPADMPLAPSLPNGDVLGQLLTMAVDRALRDGSAALWTALSATGFVGPGSSILSVLSQAFGNPLQYLWQYAQSLRREDTLSVAGVLTGPRVISLSSVELGLKEASNPDAMAAFGPDTSVLQRMIVKVAADTYDDPFPITLEILGSQALPPSFTACVLSLPTVAAPIDLGPLLQLSIDPLNAPFAIAMTGFGTVREITGSPPKLTLSANVPRTLRFGPDGGIHINLQQPVLEATVSLDGWSAQFGLTGFELDIPQSAAGSLLAIFLPPGGISLRGKLLFRVDEHGFHFDGGVGLSAAWPDVVRLPGIVIHDITTNIAVSGPQLLVTAAGTVVVSLGPLTITLVGLGVAQTLKLTTDGSGNLGILDLPAPSFAVPTGIGVAIDANVIKGGGFLLMADGKIEGALELALVLGSLELSIQAFGSLEEINGKLSFIVIMSVTFSPPIEIFLGLTLNAVGGVFGFDRTVDTPTLRALVRDGRTGDVLIPDDLIARADQILAEVGTTFPPKLGQYVAGPILELGWGRPVSIVTLTASVVFTFPSPTAVIIIGEFRIAAPEPDAPIIDLRADFDGIVNLTTGDVAFDASLTRSRIGTFDVAGDVALRAGSQGFVFTAGGFHPAFAPPPDLAAMRRLSISLSPSPVLQIWAEAYFALTANTVQFGAAMYLEAKFGPIGAKGHVSLDTLIRTDPKLHFIATISGEFHLIVSGEEIATANVDVLLEGPGHWHARAHASIDLFLFSISGTLDLDWGTDVAVLLGPPVDVPQRVHDALNRDPVWSHVLPASDAGAVQLRSGATALHPLGMLRLTQTDAPLDVSLTKFGASSVTSNDPVTVEITASGGVATVAQEIFATSQFFELTDEERLSKPAYLPFDAGGLLEGDSWQVSDPKTDSIVYEESLGDDASGSAPKTFRGLDENALGWLELGAAGRRKGPVGRGGPTISVKAPTYSIVNAATGELVSSGPASALLASPRRSVDTIAVAEFELEMAA